MKDLLGFVGIILSGLVACVVISMSQGIEGRIPGTEEFEMVEVRIMWVAGIVLTLLFGWYIYVRRNFETPD